MRRRPGDFTISAAEAGGGWHLADRLWTENPLVTIPRAAFAIVDLWLACRACGGPMGGRVLPFSGGPAEQPAALMDAFALLDSWAGEKEG